MTGSEAATHRMTYRPPSSDVAYAAAVEYDAEDRIFHGRVIGLRDVITFEGATVEELEADFHGAVEDYLDLCRRRGEESDRPYSGKLDLRVPPELHRRLSEEAERVGRSLNAYLVEKLSR